MARGWRDLSPVELTALWAHLERQRRQLPGPLPPEPLDEATYQAATSEMLNRGLLRRSADGYVLSWTPDVSWREGITFTSVACAVGGMFVPLICWGAAEDPTSGLSGPVLPAAGVLVGVVLLLVAARVPFCGLRADEHGITVVNVVRTSRIAWKEVTDIRLAVARTGDGDHWGYTYDVRTRYGRRSTWVSREGQRITPVMQHERALLLAMRDAALAPKR